MPSRRFRNISHNTEVVIVKQEPQENIILSPSTDEEDLFVLPHVNFPKESSSNSLFGAPSLFSPGSSIEVESKKKFPSSKYNQEKPLDDRKEELLEEPLGIKNNSFDFNEQNSNLFNDWDPFNSESSVLFASVERKGKKTKLFDDFNGSTSEKSLKDNDDIFLFPNTGSNSSLLFSSSLSSAACYSSINVNSFKSSKLFNDNDDVCDRNVFSSSHHDDLLFESSENNSRKLNLNVNSGFSSKKRGKMKYI